jgi:hypothetical protein
LAAAASPQSSRNRVAAPVAKTPISPILNFLPPDDDQRFAPRRGQAGWTRIPGFIAARRTDAPPNQFPFKLERNEAKKRLNPVMRGGVRSYESVKYHRELPAFFFAGEFRA